MHQIVETPPPPAPTPRKLFESFQTISFWLVPEPVKLVPPTAITKGALAGVAALTTLFGLLAAGSKQSVEPSSPAAAKIT